jgi:hypothetical protein
MNTLISGLHLRGGGGVSVGSRVRVKSDFAAVYRKPGSSIEGRIVGISPTGGVARVRMDDLADSYVRAEDLVPATS